MSKGESGRKNSDKLHSELQSNLGYSTLENKEILDGFEAKFDDYNPEFPPNELTFSYLLL